MKPEKHIEDARAIESSVIKLDEEKDYKLIVEGIYGAAINYIAYICEKLLKEHRDTHKVLPKFLEDNNLNDLAKQFRILVCIKLRA